MTAPNHHRFGKYLLLDRIATGGMAEVFRGKLTGEKGFEKPIVVKKLLPQIAEEKEMVAHFIDEARLAALLQHENIIHIYDFGETEGSFFITMEYLFGKDLDSVLKKSLQKNLPISPEISLFIVSKICEGLEYAHNISDLQGKPLNIIHRDISPQNIFLTYDGKIKIIDFGIAKTTSQTTKTEVGIIKGKLAYMSPEQTEGGLIDKRSDIFSTGILLYEMITGKKMYEGDTVQVLSNAINAQYDPPEKIAPNLPSKIYEILTRALTKEITERYQSCSEMLTDIEDTLYNLNYRPNSKTLSQYIASLFEKEYLEEKEKFTDVLEDSHRGMPDISNDTPLAENYIKTKIIEKEVDHKSSAHKPSIQAFLKKIRFSGKKMFLMVSSMVLIIVILLFLLGRDGGPTKAKFAKLRMGMNYSEVIEILGENNKCDVTFGIKNCRWGTETKKIEVTFIADKAISFLAEGL